MIPDVTTAITAPFFFGNSYLLFIDSKITRRFVLLHIVPSCQNNFELEDITSDYICKFSL